MVYVHQSIIVNVKTESNNCSVPLCHGISAVDEAVCSGKGTCIGKDQCKCNPRYTGNECEKERIIVVYAAAGAYSWNLLGLVILILLLAS